MTRLGAERDRLRRVTQRSADTNNAPVSPCLATQETGASEGLPNEEQPPVRAFSPLAVSRGSHSGLDCHAPTPVANAVNPGSVTDSRQCMVVLPGVLLMQRQPSQLGLDQYAAIRGGETFDLAIDYERLNRQTRRVAEFMADAQWHTLAEISGATGDPEASVSARLRDLRRPSLGGYLVERRRVRPAHGLWEYRLLPAESPQLAA
jgi:hypothetical protein